MKHLQMIQKFLSEKRDFNDFPEYGFPFVTISRQSGAGGHLLSYVILTEFLKHRNTPLFEGWHVFDRDLCELVARDPLLQKDMEGLMAEKSRSQFNDYIESLYSGQSEQQSLHSTTLKVVRMLALIGKVIIVGRGGSLITADLPQGVHIRLVAPEPHRIVWTMKRFKINKEEAREQVKSQDRDRKKLIKVFFNRDIDDPLLYDMVWNTAKVELDVITRATLELINKRTEPREVKPLYR
jgi:cytidylate kinase